VTETPIVANAKKKNRSGWRDQSEVVSVNGFIQNHPLS
jgi:hypothetical protein